MEPQNQSLHYASVSDLARRLGVRPRDISDLFYARRLDDARCPIVGGRRLIPEDYVSEVESELKTTQATPCECEGGQGD